MKLPKVPLVRFYGTMTRSDGTPMVTTMRMVPQIPAVDIRGVLIGTKTYEWELDADGAWDINVIPTNIGCEEPWFYTISAGGKSAQIALPLGPAINFDELVEQQK